MMSERVEIPNNVTLEVIEGGDTGIVYTIDNKTVTIGRENVCNMRLTDEHVSNKHCQVVFRGGHFTVIDLGSLNKTKVNDRVYVQKNLHNGDILTIGKTKLQFNWQNQEEDEMGDSSKDILDDTEIDSLEE
ncbi:MAG: FHA domain-containing protein [Spirochaetota bacterium]|nr:FHA domain-containing protein [Spirochaetota bacterium]